LTAQTQQKSFVFSNFVPIPVQGMVHLKAIQKITPLDVAVSETIDQKTYMKKIRGVSAPLAFLTDPPLRRGVGFQCIYQGRGNLFNGRAICRKSRTPPSRKIKL